MRCKREEAIEANGQYSRRTSLRIYGIEKEKVESPDDIMKVIHEEMDKLDLPIEEVEIDCCHRTGTAYTDEQGKKQQPVLLKFVSWRAPNVLYQAKKNCNFYIKADLAYKRNAVLKYARNEVLDTNSTAHVYIKYVFADLNCRLNAYTHTGQYLSFNSKSEFNELGRPLDNSTCTHIYDTIARELTCE